MLEICPIKSTVTGVLTCLLFIIIINSKAPILSSISFSAILFAAYWFYTGKGYTESNTTYGLEFTDARTVSRRTDREEWFHLYEIIFTATTKTAEVIETENVLTYTGNEIKQSDIHTRDIWLQGWQGWDIEDQAIKNKIVYDVFKRNPHWSKYSISILKVLYKGEQRHK